MKRKTLLLVACFLACMMFLCGCMNREDLWPASDFSMTAPTQDAQENSPQPDSTQNTVNPTISFIPAPTPNTQVPSIPAETPLPSLSPTPEKQNSFNG